MTKRKKIVILGGGTGSSRVLMSLKDLPFDITSVVTVSDDGRSTGILRKEFTAPGMGDIRKVHEITVEQDETFGSIVVKKADKQVPSDASAI